MAWADSVSSQKIMVGLPASCFWCMVAPGCLHIGVRMSVIAGHCPSF